MTSSIAVNTIYNVQINLNQVEHVLKRLTQVYYWRSIRVAYGGDYRKLPGIFSLFCLYYTAYVNYV